MAARAADLVYSFTPTIAAGVAASAPVTVPMLTQVAVVDNITVRVPPGPRGQVGFRIASSGTQVVPVNAGEWVVTDDEILSWDINTGIDSGDWYLVGYNTGRNPHTLQVRLSCRLTGPSAPPQPGPLSAAPIDPGVLSAP